MLTTFRIRTTMAVPAAFQFDRMHREEQFTDLVIDSLVSLRPGADYLEIETTVDNTARDHRVRVLFPSEAQAQTYLADTPFDVVERAIALREDNHLYHELELETKPQQSWTAVYDEQRGLAVLSTGLMESAVRDMPERPIALTLFRSTGRTVFTNGEPNGQLLGRLTFRYWLTPLAGKPDPARLCRLGQQLAAGLRDVQLTARHIAHAGGNRQLPATASLLALAGPVVVTSILQAGGGLEIRMFNPGNEQAQAILDLAGSAGLIKTLTSAQLVDFEGQLLEQLPEFDGLNARLELEPKQIVTIRLS
jgi:alpha-mannosidase/mannosylglycerate hydrolase